MNACCLTLTGLALCAAAAGAPAWADQPGAPADTLAFSPQAPTAPAAAPDSGLEDGDEWLRAPFGERLLTEAEQWRDDDRDHQKLTPLFDYNRVDPARLGLSYEAQAPGTMFPRLGARVEVATGRKRWLYGAQLEQPLLPRGRVALGVSMVRRTDHSELQQVDDVENSLALLFGRQDYRDYFEREGLGAYVAWRVPDFSTVSVHARNDDYRSLPLWRGTRSFFMRDRVLRDNPQIDEGQVHAVMLRLERLAHRTHRTRAGLYHWIELERAGDRLGGDFRYDRALADVRSVVRLSPATTLVLRAVGGTTTAGALPVQKQFTAGGVDGLRAHAFAQYRGDQMLLGQAEYSIGLWRLHTGALEGGLHAIAFVDAGRAWSNPEHQWDVRRQRLQVDGGFGLGTSEDDLRVYFAKNLQQPRSDFVISVRLQRPF